MPSLDQPARVLVIGCGNLLRGDDALGPVLIRRLWEEGLPDGVRCADGGTGGMDVAFQMRGVEKVILIDACQSGSEPGAIFRVPGEQLATIPPPQGMHLHAFRWDHALSFARWLLKDEYPKHITVFLAEVASLNFGDPLSPSMEQAAARLLPLIREEMRQPISLQYDDRGYLRIPADIASRYFSGGSLVAQRRGPELWLLPLRGAEAGGLLLKQRNASGERSVLLWEQLPANVPPGEWPAFWDEAQSALRVAWERPQ